MPPPGDPSVPGHRQERLQGDHTTLNTFNSNKAIDNEDIVTEADWLRAIWF